MAQDRCGAPRNVYIDAGVNWCNTLNLYQQVPEVQAHLDQVWTVFGFEASSTIAAFAERCCSALSAGSTLPQPPLPPAGSTRDLARFAPSYNCSMAQLGLRPRSEHDRKVYRRQRLVPCMVNALASNLSAIKPNPRLSDAALLEHRLSAARRCPPAAAKRSSYVLLPAAIGKKNGTMRMRDSPVSLMTGGGGKFGDAAPYQVPVVDFSAWMAASFTSADFVVLKMDVEGGEHSIIPKMVRDDTLRLVDVFLWECHHMPKWWHSPCHKLLRMLRDHGVGTIYEDPYPWARKGG